MKQAGFKFLPTKKLSLFIEGKNLLENAIAKHPKNVEMKLLRLMIQENAPRFLGYSDNCTKDAAIKKLGKKFRQSKKDLSLWISFLQWATCGISINMIFRKPTSIILTDTSEIDICSYVLTSNILWQYQLQIMLS